MSIQGNINKLLGMGAAVSTAAKLSKQQAAKAEQEKGMQGIAQDTAKEKLRNIQLRNAALEMKNKAMQNMQNNGNAQLQQQDEFEQVKQQMLKDGFRPDKIDELEPEIRKQLGGNK